MIKSCIFPFRILLTSITTALSHVSIYILKPLTLYNILSQGFVFLHHLSFALPSSSLPRPFALFFDQSLSGFSSRGLQWRQAWLMIMIDSLHPIAPFLRYEYDDNTKNRNTRVMFALYIHPARTFSCLSYFAIFFLFNSSLCPLISFCMFLFSIDPFQLVMHAKLIENKLIKSSLITCQMANTAMHFVAMHCDVMV